MFSQGTNINISFHVQMIVTNALINQRKLIPWSFIVNLKIFSVNLRQHFTMANRMKPWYPTLG